MARMRGHIVQLGKDKDGYQAWTTPEMAGVVEHELNKIGWSKSGLQREIVEGIGEAVDAFAHLRVSGGSELGGRDPEYFARWLDFACTYYPPS